MKQWADPDDYEDELHVLVAQAQAGEIDQDEFEDELQELVALAILLAFLRGSGKDQSELTAYEWYVIQANQDEAQASIGNLAADLYA